jgi:N6-adenosine-specific RNA methylase IME4/ParB-like chromosome segregation protein Spo0J
VSERQIHPAAEIFPLMDERALSDLCADIAEHGLREPIWLHADGSIIDGRNRWLACQRLGIDPQFRTWDGDGSLVSFVVSLNLHRRHLDESQRAIVAARIATLEHGDNQHRSIDLPSVSQSDAAELLNVSVPSLKRAKQVIDRGAPELVQAVERGDVAVSTAADIADLELEEQREVVARGEKEILQAAKQIRARKQEVRRQERVEKLVEISRGNTELAADVTYPVIYADPPWRYEHVETESRAIENQYPTMNLDEICALPVNDAATSDAILFMWATSPKLAEAMRVLEAWGFNYRTSMVWVKDRIGMGYYARQRHELLLIATKGTPPVPAPSDRLDSVIEAPLGAHSAKPVEFYERIERMYPTLPKIELFCRSPREGWAAWGNQAAA